MTEPAADTPPSSYPIIGRVMIASSLPSLGWSRDRASGPLARAVRSTVSGRLAPAEQAWVDRIEAHRRELRSDRRQTEPIFYTGERPDRGFFTLLHKPLALSDAAGAISISPLWGLLLMRLVRELAPRSCLELGTGFGISGAYQAAALELGGAGRLRTLEGAGDWASVAENGFSALGLERAEVHAGPLSEIFDDALADAAPVDFAFLDADHEETTTLAYFRKLLPNLAEGAVIVVDDINFTPGMRRAWKTIARDPSVSLAVGLWRAGIAVVRLRSDAAARATL